MFTGIIQDIGIVSGIVKSGDWLLTIQTKLDLSKMPMGASIACSGICLTVVEKTSHHFKVQASAETLAKTTMQGWAQGTQINLEPALKLGDELGGHLVSGHVDGIAKLVSRKEEGDSLRLIFEAPTALARFIAPKGSAVIDGISLTVNEAENTRFGVNIIPHTQAVTTLGTIREGDTVNFEADMIARYIDRLLPR